MSTVASDYGTHRCEGCGAHYEVTASLKRVQLRGTFDVAAYNVTDSVARDGGTQLSMLVMGDDCANMVDLLWRLEGKRVRITVVEVVE